LEARVTIDAIANKRILIVQDDELMAQELANSFEQAGAFIVGPVGSVASAFAALRGDLPHAAVLDLLVRGETVFPVAEFLHEHGIPFVFASGFSSVVPAPYAEVKVFKKPLSPPEVTRAVAELVGAQKPARRSSYGIRKVGRHWEWHVYAEGRLVAQGREPTSLRARVAALVKAMRVKPE
jgi:ActR/RegA family two-component response regulator